MADLEANKRSVREFYERSFNEGEAEDAVERYLGPTYTQHNPQAADGAEAFIGFVKWYRGEYPQLSVEIKRMMPRAIWWSRTASSRPRPRTAAPRQPTSSGWRTGRSSSTGTCSSPCRRMPRTTTRW